MRFTPTKIEIFLKVPIYDYLTVVNNSDYLKLNISDNRSELEKQYFVESL